MAKLYQSHHSGVMSPGSVTSHSHEIDIACMFHTFHTFRIHISFPDLSSHRFVSASRRCETLRGTATAEELEKQLLKLRETMLPRRPAPRTTSHDPGEVLRSPPLPQDPALGKGCTSRRAVRTPVEWYFHHQFNSI